MMPTPNVAAKNIVSRDERARSMTQNDIQGERRMKATFIIRGERRDGEIVVPHFFLTLMEAVMRS